MARNVNVSQRKSAGEPLPVSGERVVVPSSRGRYGKPAAATPESTAAIRQGRAQRRAWEASPVGQARTRSFENDGSGWTPAQRYHIAHTPAVPTAEQRADAGRAPGTSESHPTPIKPGMYDRQLPGMADPHQAPRPAKWEELSRDQQSHTRRALGVFGTDIDTMTHDIGAQLDQAHQRAWSEGRTSPWSQHFYESGEPRQVIDASARELGVHPALHALSNAITSPNTKFSIKRASGETSYPNNEAAVHATRWIQQGGHPDEITNELSTTGTGDKRAQGYVTNLRKAATVLHEHLVKGTPIGDIQTGVANAQGHRQTVFEKAPKTGPYMNAWSDSHPQFTVADVHTGGGGGFPHLGYEKPLRTDSEGNVRPSATGKEVREKSGREMALDRTPFAHAAVDYAMRTAMDRRNMGDIRGMQAAQWGEEQLQRGEAGLRGAPRHGDVYPATPAKHDDMQLSLPWDEATKRDAHIASLRSSEGWNRARNEAF